MTLPNKITFARIISAPVIFLVYYFLIIESLAPSVGIIIVWILFFITEISDLVDGALARKHQLVSDLGKLLDPFADVICRVTYFLCFVNQKLMPVWALLIILYREITIMFIRTIMMKRGIAMGARKGGKMKSLMYFFSSVYGLMMVSRHIFFPDFKYVFYEKVLAYVLFSMAAGAALLSLLDYLNVLTKTLNRESAGSGQ